MMWKCSMREKSKIRKTFQFMSNNEKPLLLVNKSRYLIRPGENKCLINDANVHTKVKSIK